MGCRSPAFTEDRPRGHDVVGGLSLLNLHVTRARHVARAEPSPPRRRGSTLREMDSRLRGNDEGHGAPWKCTATSPAPGTSPTPGTSPAPGMSPPR
jgi:hypothetical protein